MKNKLKEIRMKEHMMNKTDFAKFLDLNYTQYIKYERDTVPTLETAIYISNKLNKHVKEIFYLD